MDGSTLNTQTRVILLHPYSNKRGKWLLFCDSFIESFLKFLDRKLAENHIVSDVWIQTESVLRFLAHCIYYNMVVSGPSPLIWTHKLAWVNSNHPLSGQNIDIAWMLSVPNMWSLLLGYKLHLWWMHTHTAMTIKSGECTSWMLMINSLFYPIMVMWMYHNIYSISLNSSHL